MIEASFEFVKRDGRREPYDEAKLARSLTLAGLAPYMLTGILDAVDPRPGMNTNSLRERIEYELALRQPRAARRYATTRTLTARGSQQAGYGWVCIHPEDLTRLNLRPGDTVWLDHGGTTAPFSVQYLEDVGRGHVWLNPREMTAMEVNDGNKLAAPSAVNGVYPQPEEVRFGGRAGADGTGLRPGRTAVSRCSPESRSGYSGRSRRKPVGAGRE
ncbi:hypothetical protein JXD38_08025 [candidate division WOR-3 bacterium]|nr:hypothetical protein [candidate division WOR-3 bacterium]